MKNRPFHLFVAASVAIVMSTSAAAAQAPAKAETKAPAKRETQAQLKAEAKVSLADAKKTALAAVPNGTIKSSELEREKGKLIYSFDIATKGKSGVDEVNVDYFFAPGSNSFKYCPYPSAASCFTGMKRIEAEFMQ